MKFSLFSKSAKAVLRARPGLARRSGRRESVSGLQRIVACDGLQRQHFQAEIANDAAHHIDTSRIEFT
jgi:hypothetical protein